MSVFLSYVLPGVGGLILLLAGSLAAWRMIPRPEAPLDIQTLWQEIQANRLAIADLVDKYETSAQRARGRGRKKRYGDDDEADTPPPAPPPALVSTPVDTKAELRARARATYPTLVR